MMRLFIQIDGILINLLGLIFLYLLIQQYRYRKEFSVKLNYDGLEKYLLIGIHLLFTITILERYHFSRESLIFLGASFLLLFLVNGIITYFFEETQLPLWRITQFMVIIGWGILARLEISIGLKQVMLTAIAYGVSFLTIWLYKRVKILYHLGIPALIASYGLLYFTNVSINGSRNWMKIGFLSFQPSEIVKILYVLFLASLLTKFLDHRHKALIGAGVAVSGLFFIQIFQVDLGAVLIFYVTFILLAYVHTTNRYYILGGGIITLMGSFLAYSQFSHVRRRIDTWINPWKNIDDQGYQLTQSLFALGNGGIFGTGLGLGQPNKIPVVTTDFIYSAIVEELGMVMGLLILGALIFFLIWGIYILNRTKKHFDFLFGAGMLILFLFQSFLILGGVTRLIPLTGVTLPFISYGGSSLVASFVMLGIFHGIQCKGNTPIKSKKRQKRNKPLRRIWVLFVVLFVLLGGNMVYFIVVGSGHSMLNTYNPRLKELEATRIRGDILDRNGHVLATTQIIHSQKKRIYPEGHDFAHIVGYIGHGKTGIEAYSNLSLIQTNTSIFHKELYRLTGEEPIGNTIMTTLDLSLQKVARNSLEGKKGTVVAIEPSTGKILAMVSTPDYDPNTIHENYEKIIADEAAATLLNRATQGLYPPGSTYKLITTIAYLEKNLASDFFYYCLGEDIIGQKVMHCYNSKAHGRLTLAEAFSKSCNTSYAHIGQDLEPARLRAISELFGYNQPILFELPTKASKFILTNEASGPAISETSIGQGETLITPLNNGMIAATIANGGVAMTPYVVHKEITVDGTPVYLHTDESGKRILTQDMADLLEEYMILTSQIGTAKALSTEFYTSASKTGSAENNTGKAHAWYIGYAPATQPEIALAIIVENGGSGSESAVPIAKELYRSYLKKE